MVSARHVITTLTELRITHKKLRDEAHKRGLVAHAQQHQQAVDALTEAIRRVVDIDNAAKDKDTARRRKAGKASRLCPRCRGARIYRGNRCGKCHGTGRVAPWVKPDPPEDPPT